MKKFILLLCTMAIIAGCAKSEPEIPVEENEMETRAVLNSYAVELRFAGGGGQNLQFWAQPSNFPYYGAILSFVLRDVEDPYFSYQRFDVYVDIELSANTGMYSEIYYPVLITSNSYIDINTIKISYNGGIFGANLSTSLPIREQPNEPGPGLCDCHPGCGCIKGSCPCPEGGVCGCDPCYDSLLLSKVPRLPLQTLELNFSE